MSRHRRHRAHANAGRTSTLGAVVVMAAVLLVLVTAQRRIADGVGRAFDEMAAEGSDASTRPPPGTVRIAVETTPMAVAVSKLTLRRALGVASDAVARPDHAPEPR